MAVYMHSNYPKLSGKAPSFFLVFGRCFWLVLYRKPYTFKSCINRVLYINPYKGDLVLQEHMPGFVWHPPIHNKLFKSHQKWSCQPTTIYCALKPLLCLGHLHSMSPFSFIDTQILVHLPKYFIEESPAISVLSDTNKMIKVWITPTPHAIYWVSDALSKQ